LVLTHSLKKQGVSGNFEGKLFEEAESKFSEFFSRKGIKITVHNTNFENTGSQTTLCIFSVAKIEI
jgi:hypothetical protein